MRTNTIVIAPPSFCRGPCFIERQEPINRTPQVEKRAPPAAHSPGRARVPRSGIWLWVTRFNDRSANGTSASDGRAGRITRSNSRSWLGRMRPDGGGAAELPIHAQGRIFRCRCLRGCGTSASAALELLLRTARLRLWPHAGPAAPRGHPLKGSIVRGDQPKTAITPVQIRSKAPGVSRPACIRIKVS